jgi:hypothetical protein
MLWMEYENTKYDHDPHFVVIVSLFAAADRAFRLIHIYIYICISVEKYMSK